MLTKRSLLLLFFLLLLFSVAQAQKADVAFVVGGSFVSDSKATFAAPCVLPQPCTLPLISAVQVDHQIFLEGTLGLSLLNAKVASLSVEVTAAGIPSQTLHLSTTPPTSLNQMSSTYLTPGFRLKLAPAAPISPFVSLGAGLAHYSLATGATNKGAIEYGGGVDFKTGIPWLGFRGEVRDFVTGDPNFGLVSTALTGNESGLHRHNVLAGGGIVFRF